MFLRVSNELTYHITQELLRIHGNQEFTGRERRAEGEREPRVGLRVRMREIGRGSNADSDFEMHAYIVIKKSNILKLD